MKSLVIWLIAFLLAKSSANEQCYQEVCELQKLLNTSDCSGCFEKLKEKVDSMCLKYRTAYSKVVHSTTSETTSTESNGKLIDNESVSTPAINKETANSTQETSTDSNEMATGTGSVSTPAANEENVNSTQETSTNSNEKATGTESVSTPAVNEETVNSTQETSTESNEKATGTESVSTPAVNEENVNSTQETSTESNEKATGTESVSAPAVNEEIVTSKQKTDTESSTKTTVIHVDKLTTMASPSTTSISDNKTGYLPRDGVGHASSGNGNDMYVLLVLLSSLAIGAFIVLISQSIYKYYKRKSHILATTNNPGYELSESA